MPKAEAYYVRGTEQGGLQRQSWLSGPFDTYTQASPEARRLRPFYPGVFVDVKRRRVDGPLPVEWPRACAPEDEPDYNLAHKAGRAALAADLAQVAERCGGVVVQENWITEIDVDVTVPALRCNVWVAHIVEAPIPIISWYGAAYPLAPVRGAWDRAHINAAHRRKATSEPRTYGDLFARLEAGLLAAIDGSAFE